LGSIKRFGYYSDLNDEHMKAISKEINLDYSEMSHNEKSVFALVYLDSEFRCTDKRHSV